MRRRAMSLPAVRIENMSEAVRANLARQHDFFAGSAGKVEAKGVVGDEKKAVKKSRKKHTLMPEEAHNLIGEVLQSKEGDRVEIILLCDPYTLPTAQQKGVFVGKDGHVHFFTKTKVRKAGQTLKAALSPLAFHFRDWGDCPIALEVDFCFSYPSGTPKKERIDYGYHTTRSDVDNLFKGLGDALTESGFWRDDSVISDLHLRKFRVVGQPHIKITVTKLSKGCLSECSLFDGIEQ